MCSGAVFPRQVAMNGATASTSTATPHRTKRAGAGTSSDTAHSVAEIPVLAR